MTLLATRAAHNLSRHDYVGGVFTEQEALQDGSPVTVVRLLSACLRA